MSTPVFPSLAGLTMSQTRSPLWETLVEKVASGRESRAGLRAYPLYKWELSFDLLRADPVNAELQTLMGFFNQVQGQLNTFYYSDPADNSVTAQPIGTGDGTTVAFQLVRDFGGFVEPVQNVNGTPAIWQGNQLVTDYSINSTGLVTFSTPPASGAALTWTGAFYWLCRFLTDDSDFERFMDTFWQLKKLQFTSVKQ